MSGSSGGRPSSSRPSGASTPRGPPPGPSPRCRSSSPGSADTWAWGQRRSPAAGEVASKALAEESREEGRLEGLSAQGPYSALARTEEEVVRLRRELAAEELRVAAVKLLRDSVAECRSAALAAVAAPVESAATRMLQRIAGSRLGRVQLGDTFEPGHVLPELAEGSVSVGQVSGGEREQIYLATRLALADVLARGERQLVVLDDVLTATDTGRLARVMGS